MDRVRIVGLTINSCSDDSQCRPDTWWEYRSTHQLCTHQIRSSCGGNLLALSHWLIGSDVSGISSNDIMYDLIEKCWIALVRAIVWGYLKLLRELVWSLSALCPVVETSRKSWQWRYQWSVDVGSVWWGLVTRKWGGDWWQSWYPSTEHHLLITTSQPHHHITPLSQHPLALGMSSFSLC